MGLREIPEIKYSKDIERLVKIYSRSYTSVVKELIRLLENDAPLTYVNQQASIARQISLILKHNDEVIQNEVEKLLTDSFVKGQAQALLSLGEASSLAEATKQVSGSLLAKQTIDKVLQDTYEDVLALTSRTDKRIKQTIREVAGQILRNNAIQGLTYDTNRKEVMEKLLKKGFSKTVKDNFKGVTDSAGRKWELKRYVNMMVKTKMSQAYTEGVRAECIDRGIDLAVISSHGARDACRQFEGMVISMTGATSGYYTLDELRASNKIFHPHCKHTVTPLSSIDLLPASVREKHEEKLKNAKNNKLI
ncbi:phage minor capsid protein [Priestia megaterium]|uniref:phage minor capsid protein n=1 Tax=Priestia megaterium TaxID=1404 RepID=UPI0023DA9C6B|nr:phage minor capsid protein [Priestia megaterium]MDF2010204.1 minor capsid protein [Priestia megaterium]